jgi:hypothetical protein
MRALAERVRRVRVCCDDWTSVCGGKSGNALQHFFAGGEPCGVFLDPPYAAEADRTDTIYRKEDLQVAHAVREWAIAHGNDTRLRIALCGYEGEHEMPADWQCVKWKAHGGMAGLHKGEGKGKGQVNRFRERPRLRIRLVDAFPLRARSLDWQEFGLWAIHQDYDEIPEGEIWIDDNTDPIDRRYFVVNATHTLRGLAQGDQSKAIVRR